MREAFELCYLKQNPNTNLARLSNGEYRLTSVEKAWALWCDAMEHTRPNWQRMAVVKPSVNQRILYRMYDHGPIYQSVYTPDRQTWEPADEWITWDDAVNYLGRKHA